MSDDKYKVTVGKDTFNINPRFVEKQKAEDNLEAIKDCYKQKLELYHKVAKEEDKEKLKDLDRLLFNVEMEIQVLFNFEPSRKHVRFWEFQGCACPRMDNYERWPNGPYIVVQDCKLHGFEVEND